MYNDAPESVRSFLSYKLNIQNRSPLTVSEYWLDIRSFLRFVLMNRGIVDAENMEKADLQNLDMDFIASISSTDIYDYLLWIAGNGVKAVSRSRKLSAIRAFFKYHKNKTKLLKNDPSANIDSPSVKQKLPKYLSLEEAHLLLNSVDLTDDNGERDYCILTLFLNCGMRLSELVGINLSDFSYDLSKLTVTGKGSKQRNIYLNEACRDAVKAYIIVRGRNATKHNAVIKDKNALFLSGRYTRISNKTVQWVVNKYLDKAGLGGKGFSVHKLRHTAATLMYDLGGVDVRVLKEILGHEQLNTTQIYTHVSDKQIEQAMAKNPLAHKDTKD